MTNKEKLVQLINQGVEIYSDGYQRKLTAASAIADYLIAHGVTVQEWIPVTERLPEIGKQVLTLDKWGGIRNRKLYAFVCGHLDFQPDGVKPGADITHWAYIPKPPDGWEWRTDGHNCYQRKRKQPEKENDHAQLDSDP